MTRFYANSKSQGPLFRKVRNLSGDNGIDYCIAFHLYREPKTLEDLVTVAYVIPKEGDRKATESYSYSKWFVPIYLTVKDNEDYVVVDDTPFLEYFK